MVRDAHPANSLPVPYTSTTLRSLPAHPRFVIPIVAGIGNALMTVPMVRQIKQLFPGAHVIILARIGAMAEPFRRLSEVDEVLVTGTGAKGLLRNVLWARRARADVYLVPFPSNRWQYSLLALMSGAKRKVLHAYPVGKIRALGFVGERLPAVRGLHDVVQNLRLLKYLGAEPDETESPRFVVNDGDRARATKMLEEIGLSARTPFIAVHAGSATTILAEAKRWPPQKYASFIRALREEFPNDVVLLEGPDESGVADEIMRAIEKQNPRIAIPGLSVLKLTGPLGDAAALLERASLYAGTDSGLAHLAASVGTRAVTIFAPADPQRVCPFGNRDLVVKPDKPCSPCFMYPWETPYPKMRCQHPFCITEVTVEQVMQAVRTALVHNRVEEMPR
jgi:ADP-heptose:LPS heptosyltransferase